MNEKIGLQDLIALLAEKSDITKKDAETLIKECSEMMGEALINDKILKIRTLGTFKLVLVEDRESVNVSTGERVLIPAHYKVSFSPDIELAEKVNTPYATFENVEIEEETAEDDENENDEEKLIDPHYIPEENEDQEEPEIEEIESKEEEIENKQEEIESKQEEVENEEEPEIIEIEQQESVYFEQYKENHKPAKTNKRSLWIFSGIAFVILIFLAGYFLHPMISSWRRWLTIPDSIKVFSYTADKSQIPDSAKASAPDSIVLIVTDTAKIQAPTPQTAQPNTAPKAQPVEMPKAQPAAKLKTQPIDSQPSKTDSGKQYTILNGERLNTIALREYGHKAFWVYIYDENRDKIDKPDLIVPGIIINIPPAAKYGIDKNNQESVEKALRLEQQYKR